MVKSWKHQTDAKVIANERTHNAWVKPNYALFMEPGCGKTKTVLDILSERFDRDGFLPTVILCPLVVCENWRREILMHTDIDESLIGVYNVSGPKRLKTLNADLKTKKIFIINYDAILNEQVFQSLMGTKLKVLICDESHRLKSHNAKRSQKVFLLSKAAKWRFLLSGTPALKSPMDLFQQFKIMDAGKTFGENFWAFRGHFFEDKNARWVGRQGYFPDFQPRQKMMPEMETRVHGLSFSALKKDCLDLPPLVRKEIIVDLSPEQKRLYNEMKRDFVTFIENEGKVSAVVATMAMTKLQRLHQITTGFANNDKGETIELKDVPRLTALRDLLEDVVDNHKVIVWACYKHNYKMIAGVLDRMDVKYNLLTGDQNAKEKQENIDSFQNDPSVRVMVANQSAGGIGVNLTASSYSIYYSKDFSLENDNQSEARNYRGGSEIHESVTRVDLHARGTTDDVIKEALSGKSDILSTILAWAKNN